MEEVRKRTDILKKQLRKYPKGELYITHNGEYTKWYRSVDGELVYLPKKKKDIAASLANKRNLKNELARLTLEYESAVAFLDHYKAHAGSLRPDFDDRDLKGIDLKNDIYGYVSEDEFVKNWLTEEFIHNPKYAEGLTFRTGSGIMVRSKSEVIIDTILTDMHIPHRYECQLKLGDMIFYPDFTLLNPKRRKIIYFEHFGMMDNEQYSGEAYRKLGIYNSFGIIQGVNLITTFEDFNNRLDLDYVKNQLAFYFD